MPLLMITATGLEEFRARLAAARTLLPMSMELAIEEICQQVLDDLRTAAPIGIGPTDRAPGADVPGPLVESFADVTLRDGIAFITGTVTTTQPTKLKFIRFGTGIYGPNGQRIYPKQASALAWVDPLTGLLMVRRSVAGMKPRDFVTPILEVTRATAPSTLRAVVAEALAGLLA